MEYLRKSVSLSKKYVRKNVKPGGFYLRKNVTPVPEGSRALGKLCRLGTQELSIVLHIYWICCIIAEDRYNMQKRTNNMSVTEEQKLRMAKNLDKAFDLLKTVMELKLAYLKKILPGKTEAELIRKIHLDAIQAKERQWKAQEI